MIIRGWPQEYKRISDFENSMVPFFPENFPFFFGVFFPAFFRNKAWKTPETDRKKFPEKTKYSKFRSLIYDTYVYILVKRSRYELRSTLNPHFWRLSLEMYKWSKSSNETLRCQKCGNSGKFWKKSGGPAGSLMDPLQPFLGPFKF